MESAATEGEQTSYGELHLLKNKFKTFFVRPTLLFKKRHHLKQLSSELQRCN